ncbi:RidA family protein [Pedobacter sp. HMF7647]|uniref:RidA family protein n=1 Tax=Hufsiella arboris TaxID=2695275 RepID=A0A7K1Y619_9SPHI|nr:RidA family protein [Hufsiella arboris]MXV50022.1 RidA family protein [Hufsiella arboris]
MKSIVKTANAPAPIGPYNQAIKAGNFLYISGQIAIDPQTNDLVLDSISSETQLVLNNLKAILNEADYDFSNVVKTTIFLKDMALFAEVNEIYSSYFTTDFPARETVAVAGLPKGVNVEISVIAYKS